MDTKDYVPLMLAAGLAVAGVGTAQAAEGIPHGYVGYDFSYSPKHENFTSRSHTVYASFPVLPWLDLRAQAGKDLATKAQNAPTTLAMKQYVTTRVVVGARPHFDVGSRTELGATLAHDRNRMQTDWAFPTGARSVRSYTTVSTVGAYAEHSFNSRWYMHAELDRHRIGRSRVVKRDRPGMVDTPAAWATSQAAFIGYRFTPQWETQFTVIHEHKGGTSYGAVIQYDWK